MIMKLYHLKNKPHKIKDPTIDILQYKNQRNYVVNLNHQSNPEHFNS